MVPPHITDPPCKSAPVLVEGGEKEIEKVVGKLTGITIFGKSNLVMRERRWKKMASKVVVVEQTKKDMIAYALSKTQQLQQHGDIVFTRASDSNDILRPIVPENFSFPCKFEKGWALRKGHGHMYGEKYTRNFRIDIEEQYQLGEVSSNAKSSPAKILEYLQKKYPEELCLPSESDIRAEISRLMAKKKKEAANKTGQKKKKDAASTPVNGRQKKTSATNYEAQGTQLARTEKEYLKFIIELAALPISPKEAVVRLMEKFSKEEYDQLTERQLSNSFSYQRRKILAAKQVQLDSIFLFLRNVG